MASESDFDVSSIDSASDTTMDNEISKGDGKKNDNEKANGNGKTNGNGKSNGKRMSNSRGKINGNGKVNGNGGEDSNDPMGKRDPPNGKYIVKRLSKVSRNPFFNYVRRLRMRKDFRTIQDLLKAAAVEWKTLTPQEKQEYIGEANNVDPSYQPAPFYKLGEHKLGASLRRNLAKFKTLLDNAVEQNLRQVYKKERKDDDFDY